MLAFVTIKSSLSKPLTDSLNVTVTEIGSSFVGSPDVVLSETVGAVRSLVSEIESPSALSLPALSENASAPMVAENVPSAIGNKSNE